MNFILFFIPVVSVSDCNASRYISGRCGGTKRAGILAAGKKTPYEKYIQEYISFFSAY